MEKTFKVGDYVRIVPTKGFRPEFQHYIGYEGYITRCDNGWYKLDKEPIVIKYSALQLVTQTEVTENEVLDLFQP